jgi:hypothetical protein
MNRDNKAMRMWEYAFAWGRNGTVYKDINGNLVTQNVREYLSQVGEMVGNFAALCRSGTDTC